MWSVVAVSGLHIGNLRYILRPKTIREADACRSFRRTSNEMDIDAIHKALANPLRREILEWLKEPERHFPDQELPHSHGVCAGQIDGRCGMSQSTVSAHLSVLHKAGLVTTKRVGQWVFFRRDEAVIQAFRDSIGNL